MNTQNTRRTLLRTALGIAALCTIQPAALAQFPAPIPVVRATGLQVVVKSANGSFRFAVDQSGKFSLGTLPAGSYEISFAYASSDAAKTFYESRSNTARTVTMTEGANNNSAFWDSRSNVIYSVVGNGLTPVGAITFTATGESIVSGQICGIAIGDKGAK